MGIPLVRPDMTEAYIEAAAQVLKTLYLSLGLDCRSLKGKLAQRAQR